MSLPFLNRISELSRLRRAFDTGSPLVAVYGRRRLGKSRLLREAVADRPSAWYVADRRDAALQRESLAREIGRTLPRFDAVVYPDWDSLFERLYSAAPQGFVMALDELPELVVTSPELPSVLQRHVDVAAGRLTLALCGSSQTMMHGLVLDATTPLYGRATEILKLRPLNAHWLREALDVTSPSELVEWWALLGGVPRHWELARGRPFWDAMRDLVLDPLGPLHAEPDRLLRDDIADPTRASSILALVGQGCHRTSEIAGRVGVPASDLARPLARLCDLGFLRREVPFGLTLRDTKRTRYSLGDPFLRFWYRFVDPNRSLLEAGVFDLAMDLIRRDFRTHLGGIWEDLSLDAVPWLTTELPRAGVAGRWWGTAAGGPVELDVVAAFAGAPGHLVGAAKLTITPQEAEPLLEDLRRRAARVPNMSGPIEPVLFVLDVPPALAGHPRVIGPAQVMVAR